MRSHSTASCHPRVLIGANQCECLSRSGDISSEGNSIGKECPTASEQTTRHRRFPGELTRVFSRPSSTVRASQETKEGPEVTLTRQTGDDKVVVKFNVTNTVNASDAEPELEAKAGEQEEDSKSQLKSRPSFTVEITRGAQTLSFLCSFLPNDYAASREQLREMAKEENQGSEPEDWLEDFQIDEFTIHEGEWNEKIYSSDCSVIDGELYDKLLNVLEEHGIGEGSFRQHCMCNGTSRLCSS